MFKMPPVMSKLKQRVLHNQTREVVWNVLHFMEQEAKQGSFTIPVSKAQGRTEAASSVKCALCEKFNQRGKILLSLDKETLHSQLRIKKKETAKEMSLDLTSLIYA
jgi:hypothetical protein